MKKKEFNWMRYRWLYFSLSFLALFFSFVALIKWGLRPAIDFTGGSLLELKGGGVSPSIIEEALGKKVVSFQQTEAGTVIVRLPLITGEEKDKLLEQLEKTGVNVELLRWESIGPSLGKELLRKTLVSLVLAIGFILLYLAYRFADRSFGIFAILAMLHDTLIVAGSYSWLGHWRGAEVDALFITALLTILSFSVHDTVVVYDRIREIRRLQPKLSWTETANLAVSQTLVRSINNSLTIIFMLLSLFFLGGRPMRWFVFALLVGTISGTYSSTFTAVPLLVTWKEWRQSRARRRPA